MKWSMAGALLFVAFAGCSDGGGEAAADGGHTAHAGASEYGGDVKQVTQAPQVALGDWWSYKYSFDRVYNIVVAEESGSDWIFLANDLQIALFDYQFDISFIGPMSKSALSGKQGSQTIKFMDFPLEHGKSWNTDWDGVDRHVVAHAADGGKWHIIAHVGSDEVGDKYAEYVYDPAAGFFETMTFFNTTDGSVSYQLQLDGNGDSFSGSAYRYTSIDPAVSMTQEGPGFGQAVFPVGTEQEVQIDYEHDCGTTPGQILFGVMPPGEDGSQQILPPAPVLNEPAWGFQLACPGGMADAGTIVLAAVPGDWRADGLVGNADARYDVAISLRTYETLTF